MDSLVRRSSPDLDFEIEQPTRDASTVAPARQSMTLVDAPRSAANASDRVTTLEAREAYRPHLYPTSEETFAEFGRLRWEAVAPNCGDAGRLTRSLSRRFGCVVPHASLLVVGGTLGPAVSRLQASIAHCAVGNSGQFATNLANSILGVFTAGAIVSPVDGARRKIEQTAINARKLDPFTTQRAHEAERTLDRKYPGRSLPSGASAPGLGGTIARYGAFRGARAHVVELSTPATNARPDGFDPPHLPRPTSPVRRDLLCVDQLMDLLDESEQSHQIALGETERALLRLLDRVGVRAQTELRAKAVRVDEHYAGLNTPERVHVYRAAVEDAPELAQRLPLRR